MKCISEKIFLAVLFSLSLLLVLLGCAQQQAQQGSSPDASAIEAGANDLQQGIDSLNETDNDLSGTDLGSEPEAVEPSDLSGSAAEAAADELGSSATELQDGFSGFDALDSELTDFNDIDALSAVDPADLGG
ncbi:MAG: hypothetical protein V1494_02815 [Candidatus Diapherotrites archaeon]